MKKLSHHLLLFIFLILLSGKVFSQLGPNGLPIYEVGKIYVQLKFSSTVSIHHKDTVINDPSGNFHALFTKYQVTKTERPFAFVNDPTLNKNYCISFTQTARVDSFIIDLSQISSDVQFVEKVPAVYTFSVPNDPLVTVNGTTYSSDFYYMPLINADQASSIYTANLNVTVAIVDDAVLTSHEDLFPNIGTVNTGSDVTNGGDPNPNPPITGSNAASNTNFTHGTHVAGIAGAATDNSKGIASIGWNNKLMCVKTKSDGNPSNGLNNPFEGLLWAAANGASVINMSWGTYAFAQTQYTAVVWAKNQGVVLVASAGNDRKSTPLYPAAYGEGTTGQSWEVLDEKLVVAVAALDQSSNISVWGSDLGSNYGYWVDVAAYGTDIMSTLAASATGSATNQYGKMSGTSMAAPMVSGIAGVMRSYNPSKTPDEIIDCIIHAANPDIYGGAHPTNQVGTLGSGRLDAAAALRCVSSNCSVSPVVIIVPSSPSLCANTTLTLAASQGASSYTWSNGATTQAIVTSTPNTYSVIASYTAGGGCTATASITFSTPPTLTPQVSTNTNICPGNTVNLLSATGSYSSLVWQPGGMTTASAIVNPTAYTVYTVTANPLCGGTTATIGVNPNSNSLPSFVGYSVLGPTLVGNYYSAYPVYYPQIGRYILSSDATVQTVATFYNSDVLVTPNAKITVPTGSTLNINFSHLHSCGTDMWQGIVLEDGAQVISENLSCIEDAIEAITSTHTPLISAGQPPGVIWLQSTVFNKNYIDISMTNYYDLIQGSLSYSNSIKVDNCAFTCRDFSALPLWPSAGDLSTPGIRAPSSPTTGLSTPYDFGNYSLTPLKAPHGGQPSHISIKLTNVGITNGGSTYEGIKIGDDAHASGYNLFDSHDCFIYSKNSNVTLVNNVFQNQKHTVLPSVIVDGSYFAARPSAAVMHYEGLNMKTELEMGASSSNLGNRFWDCHRCIDGHNLYRFHIENGIFRSTQNYTNTAYGPGNSGITLNTDRFQYFIFQNEFSNIANCINIPIGANIFPTLTGTVQGSSSGIYATHIAILNNTFSGETASNGYISKAINISNPNNFWWTVTEDCFFRGDICTGLRIENNEMNNVYRGIYVNGCRGFKTDIASNAITLTEDITASPKSQNGINYVNSLSMGNVWRQSGIRNNLISGDGTDPTSAVASVALVYNEANIGQASPEILCNTLTASYDGFSFAGICVPSTSISGTRWLGNVMENLHRGMVSYSAIIGQQGTSSEGMGNTWQGSWPGSGATYGIWTNNTPSTSAQFSPLWSCGICSNSNPPNLDGNPYPESYGAIGVPTVAVDYSCSEPTAMLDPYPVVVDYDTDEQKFIGNFALYSFLYFNDSILGANGDFDNFYQGMDDSNLDYFMQVEQELYGGSTTNARDLLSLITPTNSAESNFVLYYNLYANYIDARDLGEPYSYEDSTSLVDLTQLCPVINGFCIHQARALFNTIYGEAVNYPECDDGVDPRPGPQTPPDIREKQKNQQETQQLKLQIYPNPTQNSLHILLQKENQVLDIMIRDVSGRLLRATNIVSTHFIANLDLDLIAGVYFITITNDLNQTTTKKLFVAK